jgi:hypothetical protein
MSRIAMEQRWFSTGARELPVYRADAGYQGPRVASAAANTGGGVVEIVKRYEMHKFVVLTEALDRGADAGMDQS